MLKVLRFMMAMVVASFGDGYIIVVVVVVVDGDAEVVIGTLSVTESGSYFVALPSDYKMRELQKA